MNTALITGITGQDGFYLTKFLLTKQYRVVGTVRNQKSAETFRKRLEEHRIAFNDDTLKLCELDLKNQSQIEDVIIRYKPEEIYHFAAQTKVSEGLEMPEYMADINSLATLRFLEVINNLKSSHNIRFFNASSSSIYGTDIPSPQNEKGPFHPKTYYGITKLFSYWLTIHHREKHNLFASNGILFNHESPLRDKEYTTRKIPREVVAIVKGEQNKLQVANLDVERDWGHAEDFVKGIWAVLQYDKADDFVLATGIATSIRTFIQLCFEKMGIEIAFSGKREFEKGVVIDINDEILLKRNIKQYPIRLGQTVVELNHKTYNPNLSDKLKGDYSKIKEKLNWNPKKTIEDVVEEHLNLYL